jgi:hypothetical protein
MLTNFDLIWMHTKSLAEKLMSSSENMLSETLYTQYCSAFDQLINIIENEPETVDADKMEDMRITISALDNAFAEEQKRLQDQIAVERIKKQASDLYKTNIFSSGNYDKTT